MNRLHYGVLSNFVNQPPYVDIDKSIKKMQDKISDLVDGIHNYQVLDSKVHIRSEVRKGPASEGGSIWETMKTSTQRVVANVVIPLLVGRVPVIESLVDTIKKMEELDKDIHELRESQAAFSETQKKCFENMEKEMTAWRAWLDGELCKITPENMELYSANFYLQYITGGDVASVTQEQYRRVRRARDLAMNNNDSIVGREGKILTENVCKSKAQSAMRYEEMLNFGKALLIPIMYKVGYKAIAAANRWIDVQKSYMKDSFAYYTDGLLLKVGKIGLACLGSYAAYRYVFSDHKTDGIGEGSSSQGGRSRKGGWGLVPKAAVCTAALGSATVIAYNMDIRKVASAVPSAAYLETLLGKDAMEKILGVAIGFFGIRYLMA